MRSMKEKSSPARSVAWTSRLRPSIPSNSSRWTRKKSTSTKKRKRLKTVTIRERMFSPLRFSFAGVAACLLVLLTILHPRPLGASKKEKPCGLITGTVWGPDDRELAGVKVKIRSAQDKKAHWEMYSDRRGEFWQWVSVCGADYIVAADTKGYKAPDGKRLQPAEVTVHVETRQRAQT